MTKIIGRNDSTISLNSLKVLSQIESLPKTFGIKCFNNSPISCPMTINNIHKKIAAIKCGFLFELAAS